MDSCGSGRGAGRRGGRRGDRGDNRASGSNRKNQKGDSTRKVVSAETTPQNTPTTNEKRVTRSATRQCSGFPARNTPHPTGKGVRPGNVRLRIGNQIYEGPFESLESPLLAQALEELEPRILRRSTRSRQAITPQPELRRSARQSARQSVARRLIFDTPEETPEETPEAVRNPEEPEDRRSNPAGASRDLMRCQTGTTEQGTPAMGISLRLRPRNRAPTRPTTRPISRIPIRQGIARRPGRRARVQEEVDVAEPANPPISLSAIRRNFRRCQQLVACVKSPPEPKTQCSGHPRRRR